MKLFSLVFFGVFLSLSVRAEHGRGVDEGGASGGTAAPQGENAGQGGPSGGGEEKKEETSAETATNELFTSDGKGVNEVDKKAAEDANQRPDGGDEGEGAPKLRRATDDEVKDIPGKLGADVKKLRALQDVLSATVDRKNPANEGGIQIQKAIDSAGGQGASEAIKRALLKVADKLSAADPKSSEAAELRRKAVDVGLAESIRQGRDSANSPSQIKYMKTAAADLVANRPDLQKPLQEVFKEGEAVNFPKFGNKTAVDLPTQNLYKHLKAGGFFNTVEEAAIKAGAAETRDAAPPADGKGTTLFDENGNPYTKWNKNGQTSTSPGGKYPSFYEAQEPKLDAGTIRFDGLDNQKGLQTHLHPEGETGPLTVDLSFVNSGGVVFKNDSGEVKVWNGSEYLGQKESQAFVASFKAAKAAPAPTSSQGLLNKNNMRRTFPNENLAGVCGADGRQCTANSNVRGTPNPESKNTGVNYSPTRTKAYAEGDGY